MHREHSLHLSLEDEYGKEIAVVCINIPRERSEAPALDSVFDTFPSCIEKMKKRDFRKTDFEQIAARLGALLSERLEDKDGWNGEERAERIKNDQ